MARKSSKTNTHIAGADKSSGLKVFLVTKKLIGNINHKEFSHEVGEKIELTEFEASVFQNFIKEE